MTDVISVMFGDASKIVWDFEDGDRVFFARGLKYPMEFPIAGKDKITCPVCGTTIEVEPPVCRGCRLDLTELSEPNQ